MKNKNTNSLEIYCNKITRCGGLVDRLASSSDDDKQWSINKLIFALDQLCYVSYIAKYNFNWKRNHIIYQFIEELIFLYSLSA